MLIMSKLNLSINYYWWVFLQAKLGFNVAPIYYNPTRVKSQRIHDVQSRMNIKSQTFHVKGCLIDYLHKILASECFYLMPLMKEPSWFEWEGI